MPYEILMPQLGLTMTEGAVTTWLKNLGDRVEKGDLVFTVQTDKVEMEVESFGRGFLERILVAPEQVVPVGTLIAVLSDHPPGSAQNEPASPPVSPRARRVAQELNVDLTAVKPASGKRITEDDVRLFHETHQVVSKPKAAEGLTAARKKNTLAKALKAVVTEEVYQSLGQRLSNS